VSKLDEQINEIIQYWDFSPHQDEDTRVQRVHDEINRLIHEAEVAAVQGFCEDIAKKIEFEFKVGGRPGQFILPWENIVRPIIYSQLKRR